jgi:hypothetical protein
MANPNERSGPRDKNKTGSVSRSSSKPTARQPGNTNQGMQQDHEGRGRNKEGHTGQRESARTSDLDVE